VGRNTDTLVAGAQPIRLEDFNYARLTVDHLTNISDEEMQKCYIDLRPYMNPAPHRVPMQSSLSRMFQVGCFVTPRWGYAGAQGFWSCLFAFIAALPWSGSTKHCCG
jgi:hypothetical protein